MKQPDYREKSNRGLVAIIAIIFLLIAYTCSSQTPMKFSCGKFDTIYVSITQDTIMGVYRLETSCTKHKHSEWKSITFGFVNGDMTEVFSEGGWVIMNPKLLREVEFDYVSFDEQFFSTACINIRTKDYFTKYFSQVEK